jgi:hypothetical protein
MHIRPIPLGLTIFGASVMIGSVNENVRWFLRNPVWSMQNWRSMLRGVIGWWIAGIIALIVGIVGLIR